VLPYLRSIWPASHCIFPIVVLAVVAAQGVVIKLMGSYLALAVLGLMVLLVLLENIGSSTKNDDGECPAGSATVDGTKMNFQVGRQPTRHYSRRHLIIDSDDT